MDHANVHNLAEQIARLLRQNANASDNGSNSGNGETDAAFLRASLEKLNQRLEKIESGLQTANQESTIENQKSFHPSLDKFTNLEELADEIIDNFQNEKACPFEPAGKPCDNCSMCNSRGF